jgi:alpha,alpha-trehalase
VTGEVWQFQPQVLREYALLADGYRGALCGPRGEIAWMCAPLWHDDAVFSALLGGAGHYVIEPEESFVWGGFYEPRSLIWRNRWVTTSTIVECREALARPANRETISWRPATRSTRTQYCGD